MAQATWERPLSGSTNADSTAKKSERWKFFLGGAMMIAAIIVMVIGATMASVQSFTTVEEVMNNPENFVGRTIRISGAVIGDTIQYDREELNISFTISHIPNNYSNLADALFRSVNDPTLPKMTVYVESQVKPDLLRHEAQAIITGVLGEDGVFYASELFLKCPSRMEDGGSRHNLSEDGTGHEDMVQIFGKID
jgi:cytochrome c-type biogenesis protein CcmE